MRGGGALATTAIALLLAACTPHASARAPAPASAPPAERLGAHRAGACAATPGEPIPSEAAAPVGADPLPDGANVVDVRADPAGHVPPEWILGAFPVHAGDRLDAARVDEGIAELYSLGAFEDVRVEARDAGAGSVSLLVSVVERPLVRAVFYADGAARPSQAEWVPPQEGDIYDPAVVARASDDLLRTWRALGYLDATVAVGARRVAPDRVDLCVHADKGASWKIERVDFPGASVVPADELRAAMKTDHDVANAPGLPWREDLMARSLLVLQATLYDHGLIASKVLPPRAVRSPRDHTIRVEIPIEEGKVYKLRRVQVRGRLAGKEADYLDALGAVAGETFSRKRFMEGMERVRAKHRALGGAATDDLEPQTELDSDAATVDITIVVGAAP